MGNAEGHALAVMSMQVEDALLELEGLFADGVELTFIALQPGAAEIMVMVTKSTTEDLQTALARSIDEVTAEDLQQELDDLKGAR